MATHAELQQILDTIRYKPGWLFALRPGPNFGTGSLFNAPVPMTSNTGNSVTHTWPQQIVYLVIEARVPDSSHPQVPVNVQHIFAVPPEPFPGSWNQWLLRCVFDVERHEAMEFFEVGGHKPFYPEHGPGVDLYAVKEKQPR